MKAPETINVFIGYDPVETVSFHTMVQSLIEYSSKPLNIHPVNIRNYKDIYFRKKDPKQSNEFSFSRFLVPYLMNYRGFGIFFDCDMMLRDDVTKIFDNIDENKAVSVVKHSYLPRDDIKYLDNVQYSYPRKNWSSVVVWNCGHPKNKELDLNFINTKSGLELHRFSWLDDYDIGELDVTWNWLVGEYDNPPENVKNVHWTIGGPYFKEFRDVDFSEEWRQMHQLINFCKQR